MVNRRNFLQDILVTVPALAWAQESPLVGRSIVASQTKIATASLQPKDDARLKHSPTQGALQGELYHAWVPDTLDLILYTDTRCLPPARPPPCGSSSGGDP